MTDTWLILDCNFLCHRAKWAIGDLSHNGEQTGVLFGFLSDVLGLEQQFQAQHVIYCFDVGTSKRKEMLPCYKATRHQPTKNATPEDIEETKQEYKRFRKQVHTLRTQTLPALGYPNILAAPGYEADDWIARACLTIAQHWPFDQAVIITADHDLLQCIAVNVNWYNPNQKQVHTLSSFREKYGILPRSWCTVKALAGCSGDNIPGITGVGEKTAIKYLRGELKPGKILDKLNEEEQHIRAQNLPLVKLPLGRTPEPTLIKQTQDIIKWRKVTADLGMTSLIKARKKSLSLRKRKRK